MLKQTPHETKECRDKEGSEIGNSGIPFFCRSSGFFESDYACIKILSDIAIFNKKFKNL